MGSLGNYIRQIFSRDFDFLCERLASLPTVGGPIDYVGLVDSDILVKVQLAGALKGEELKFIERVVVAL